jgi:hypothetical protein
MRDYYFPKDFDFLFNITNDCWFEYIGPRHSFVGRDEFFKKLDLISSERNSNNYIIANFELMETNDPKITNRTDNTFTAAPNLAICVRYTSQKDFVDVTINKDNMCGTLSQDEIEYIIQNHNDIVFNIDILSHFKQYVFWSGCGHV